MLIRFQTENEWLVERSKNITSTEVASLFNLKDKDDENKTYKSEWQIWHEKKGNYHEVVEGERPKWGLRLENSIAEGIAQDQGWNIDPEQYKFCLFKHGKERLSASIDRMATCPKRGKILIECKVISLNVWNEQFDFSKNIIPARFEFQLQSEMLCTGVKYAVLACLVDGQVHLFFRKSDDKIQELILKKVNKFWKSIEEDREPSPDFTDQNDQEMIFKMFRAKPLRKETDLSTDNHLPELCARYLDVSAEEKMAKMRKDALKSEIITKIGDAEKIKVGENYLITSAIVEGKEISYIREAYRDFRIFKKDPTKKRISTTNKSSKTKGN